MASELLIEMVDKHSRQRLPRGCVSLKFLPDPSKKQALRMSNPALSNNLLKTMVKKDSKVKDKLLELALSLKKTEPMTAGMPEATFTKSMLDRIDITGNRLRDLVISDAGVVDLGKSGVYAFAKKVEHPRLDEVEYEILEKARQKDATHIVHRPAGHGVELSSFGVESVNDKWHIANNWSETCAELQSDKRMRVPLYEDFKDMRFLKYNARLEEKNPHSPSLSNFGAAAKEDMAKKNM